MLNTIKNKEGEIVQFENLYKLYCCKLKRFIFGYVRDDEETADIIQNIFMILWQRRLSFDANTNWDAYIFTIARNLCIDSLRKQINRAKPIDQDISDSVFDAQMNVLALEDFRMGAMDFSILENQIERILSSLPAETRKSFLLSREEGLKYKDIAILQDVSVKTVEKRISTALSSLRSGLQIFM